MVNMAWSVRYKTVINESKYRDPNAGVYNDIEGVVTKTFALYWDRIYSMLDNDELS